MTGGVAAIHMNMYSYVIDDRDNRSNRGAVRRVWENAASASPECHPPSCNLYLTALSRRIVTAASTKPNAATARRSTAIPRTSTRCTCSASCATSKASTPKPPSSCAARWTCARTTPALQLNLGNALKALGQIDDAIEQFRNALTLAAVVSDGALQPGQRIRGGGPSRRRRRRVRKIAAPATERRVVVEQPRQRAARARRHFGSHRRVPARARIASRSCRRAQQPGHGAERARSRGRRDPAVSRRRWRPSRAIVAAHFNLGNRSTPPAGMPTPSRRSETALRLAAATFRRRIFGIGQRARGDRDATPRRCRISSAPSVSIRNSRSRG